MVRQRFFCTLALMAAMLVCCMLPASAQSWTLFYSQTFSESDGKWAPYDTNIDWLDTGGRVFGGGDAAHYTNLTLSGLPEHSQVKVVFDFIAFGYDGSRWDGNADVSGQGPDNFRVLGDSTTVFEETFSQNENSQSYASPADRFFVSGGHRWDEFQNVTVVFNHTAANLIVGFQRGSTGYTSGDYELYQLDDVEIYVPGTEPVPEPSTLLLLSSGAIGLVASGLRRRRA